MQLAESNEFSKILESTCDILRQAVKDHNFYFGKVNEMDKLTQDYLHSLELDGLKYEDRAKVATKLQKCRQERRQYKDYVQSLTPLVDMLESDKGKQLFNLLTEVLGKTRKVESFQKNRTYKKKVI